MPTEEWAYEGRCHPSKNGGTTLTALFYPDQEYEYGTEEYHAEAAATVAAYCVGCPVRQQCHDYAVRTEQEYGIWGGEDFTRPPDNRKRKR